MDIVEEEDVAEEIMKEDEVGIEVIEVAGKIEVKEEAGKIEVNEVAGKIEEIGVDGKIAANEEITGDVVEEVVDLEGRSMMLKHLEKWEMMIVTVQETNQEVETEISKEETLLLVVILPKMKMQKRSTRIDWEIQMI